jgi:hypothetical protein
LVESFTDLAAEHGGIRLVAEGLAGEGLVLGGNDPAWRLIVDPIDGTRGIMYQKRSAWILSGLAPERGPETGLHDIVAAAMTEIPLVKQHLCDQLSAVRGHGVQATRLNRLDGRCQHLAVRPSTRRDLAQGSCQIARFFPGARDVLAAIDDEVVLACTGPIQPGKAACFEDQYICTGGQFYELIMGHDRFTADIRPLLRHILAERGQATGLCCHPYDLCVELVAREAGVLICDPTGAPLNAALWCQPDVSWVGYANAALRALVEPVLQASLRRRGLLP